MTTLYVSHETGSDPNSGSATAPLKTFARAHALTPDGQPGAVLLRRGRTYPALGSWIKSGVPGEPVVIGAYGDGPAPIIAAPDGIFYQRKDRALHDVRIENITFDAFGLARGFGVRLSNAARIELVNVTIRGYSTNLIAQRVDGLTLRHCTIIDAYALPALNPKTGKMETPHSQGMFCSGVTNLLVEEDTTFEHNGWREGDELSKFNQGAYVAATNKPPITFRRCVFRNNASHGAQMRSGGLVEYCTFIDNPEAALTFGYSRGAGDPYPNGVTGTVRNNKVLNTRRCQRGIWIANSNGAAVNGNEVRNVIIGIIVNTGNGYGVTDLTVSGNEVDASDAALSVTAGISDNMLGGRPHAARVVIERNTLRGGVKIVDMDASFTGFDLRGPWPEGVYEIGKRRVDRAGWVALIGGAVDTVKSWADVEALGYDPAKVIELITGGT